jgi:magnesium-transporting ATPase (P-type)
MKSFALTFTPEIVLTALSSEAWYAHARTLNFTMSIVFEMFNVFITRSGFERSTFTMNPFNNPWLWGSIGLAMGLQMIAIYVPMQPTTPVAPFTVGVHNTIFDSMIMNGYAWLLIVGICVCAAALTEFLKFIVGKYIMGSWVGRAKAESLSA